MEKLSEIVRSIGFYVREANFATVGDFWKDIVNFWKQYATPEPPLLGAVAMRSIDGGVSSLTAGNGSRACLLYTSLQPFLSYMIAYHIICHMPV